MDSHVIIRVANDAEKAGGCTSALDGTLGTAIGREDCPSRVSGARDTEPGEPPIFAMTAPSGASSVPKTQLNRKAMIAARKNAIQ